MLVSCLDSEEEEFDLEDIISISMNKTTEVSSEAYNYLVSLCRESLIRRLTPSQAKEIALELLIKIGLVKTE